jgi:plastocyanin
MTTRLSAVVAVAASVTASLTTLAAQAPAPQPARAAQAAPAPAGQPAPAPAGQPAPATAGQPATPPQGRGAPPLRGGYTEAGTLQARIMSFTAQPASIKPGETVTLNWAVENPRSVAITPDIGRAAPRGPLKVTPKATTTYTLTVTGVNPNATPGGPPATLTRTVTVTVAGTTAVAATTAAAPDLAAMPVPRTSDGKPDLSGVYGYGAGPGRGAPPAAAAPGQLPTTPTLKDEKYRVVRGPTDTGLYSTCRPPGVPQTFFVPYYTQILQGPKHVVILHEYLTLPRVILMNEEHPADPDPFYMGHSVGKWEGDTLVVDSVGFKESEVSSVRTTEALHLVERFRRPTFGTLEYEVVIEDPNVFAGPWRITRTFPFLPEHKRVDEFFCENNRDYKPLFGK